VQDLPAVVQPGEELGFGFQPWLAFLEFAHEYAALMVRASLLKARNILCALAALREN